MKYSLRKIYTVWKGGISQGEDMVRLHHLQSCLMKWWLTVHLLAQRERFLLCGPLLARDLACGLDHLWNTRICRMCNLEIGSSLGIYTSLPPRD